MAKKKAPRRKKPAAKKSGSRRATHARKKTSVGRKKTARGIRRARPASLARPRRSADIESLHVASTGRRGLGAGSAGQSGDTQGLSRSGWADSESVQELVEEGQDFEAGVVSGVEEADNDEGEVRTKQVLEDDVPLEYLDKD